MMQAHNALPLPAIKRDGLKMGNKPEIPDPPPHVPEKFAKVWASLPGCCRSFYMNPGKGCCAGMAEPNPGMMTSHKASPAKVSAKPSSCKTGNCPVTADPVSQQHSSSSKTAPTPKGWLWAVQDWFKYLGAGFLKDMKRILTGAKFD